MTAFNDILTAEKEAINSIEKAKEEVAESIVKAKAELKTRIDTEAVKLAEAEKNSITAHETHIDTVTQKIKSEIDKQVSVVKSSFESHQADLKKKIKKMFA